MGGAIDQLKAVVNPQGPLIRQAKIAVTRRLSNVIMVRGAVYTYEEEKRLDAFLICETWDGFWQQVSHHHVFVENTNTLKTYYPFQCDPGKLYRVRGFFMINNSNKTKDPTQRVLVQALGIWNIWGRDDGYDEPRTTPLDLFYDDIPLPDVSERKFQRHEKSEVVEPYRPPFGRIWTPMPEMFKREGYNPDNDSNDETDKKKKKTKNK